MSSPSSSGDDRACAVLASKRAARCIAAARAGRLVQVLSRPKLSARDDPRQDALDAMGEAHGPGSTLSDVRSSVCFSVLRHEASSVPGRRIGSDGFLDLSSAGLPTFSEVESTLLLLRFRWERVIMACRDLTTQHGDAWGVKAFATEYDGALSAFEPELFDFIDGKASRPRADAYMRFGVHVDKKELPRLREGTAPFFVGSGTASPYVVSDLSAHARRVLASAGLLLFGVMHEELL